MVHSIKTGTVTVAVLVKERFPWLYIPCSPHIIINSTSTFFFSSSGSGRTIIKRRKALMTIPCISLKRPFMSGLKADREEAGLAVSLPVASLPGAARCLCSVWARLEKCLCCCGRWLGRWCRGRFPGDKRQTKEKCM